MEVLSKQCLDLDIMTMEFDHMGVSNFYQPFDLNKMSEKFVTKYIYYLEQIHSNFLSDSYDMRVLKIAFMPIYFEMYKIYYLCDLGRILNKEKIILKNTKRYSLLDILRKNHPLGSPTLKKIYAQSHQNLRALRLPIKTVINSCRNRVNNVKRISILNTSSFHDVTIFHSKLLDSYLKENGRKCNYINKSFWFKESCNKKHIEEVTQDHTRLYKYIDFVVDDLFGDFYGWCHSSIQSLACDYKKIICYVSRKLQEIEKDKSKYIPKKLYMASSSCLRSRIIADLVRKYNGKVIKFDHGAGRAFGNDIISQWQFELSDADQFVTYSKGAELQYKKYLRDDMVFGSIDKSEIVSVRTDVFRKKVAKAIIRDKKIKKIMYLGQLFPGERFEITKSYPITEIQSFDWTIRLLSKLRSWGYDVIFKPHPKEVGCEVPPEKINKITGCKVIHDRYEHVYDKCDLVIFDAICSSTLPITTGLTERFIFIDFSIVKLSDMAKNHLNEDCHLVNGGFDASGKAYINWDELKNMLERPKINKCHFYNYFFSD